MACAASASGPATAANTTSWESPGTREARLIPSETTCSQGVRIWPAAPSTSTCSRAKSVTTGATGRGAADPVSRGTGERSRHATPPPSTTTSPTINQAGRRTQASASR